MSDEPLLLVSNRHARAEVFMTWVWIVIAVGIGAALAVQAAVNARLRVWIGDAGRTALVSFAVGTTALLVYSLLVHGPWPTPGRLATVPWWAWVGGFLGASSVVASVALVPRLGAAVYLALVVVGQLLASLALDHFGWIGLPRHPVDPGRALGATLLVIGVVLIRRS